MFYKFRFHSIFRDFHDIGYLIYQKMPFDTDRVVNNIGAIFLSELSYQPKESLEIANALSLKFANSSVDVIKNDVENFFNLLVSEGFLFSADSYEECCELMDYFDYAISQTESLRNLKYDKSQNRKSTQEYLEKYFSENPKLLKFQIEITNKCNERCIHCYIPHKDKLHDIEEETFYNTLQQLKNMGIVSLGISGGEAMLHPHFSEFIIAASELNVNMTILTNLTCLTKEHISLFKNRRITIAASLYSLNEKNHDEITQLKGSCRKTIKAIEELVKNNIPVQISCPLMKSNKNDFIELIHWAREKNIMVKTDNCIIARCDRTTDNLEHRINLEEMQEILDKLVDENELFKKLISEDDYEAQCKKLNDDQYGKWCGVCFTCCAMDVAGDVCPCPSWSDYNSGNIKEIPLNEIWLNSDNFNYIRSLSKKDFTKCISCEDKAFCTVCMAKNANESPTKSPLDINDYSCDLVHMNRISIEKWRKTNVK